MANDKSIFDLDQLGTLTSDVDSLLLQTEDGAKRVTVQDLYDMLGGYLPTMLANYKGKNLEEYYTPAEFQEKLASGDHSGLILGDYYDITLTTEEVMRYAIAGFNTYYNFGDIALTAQHAIMTPVDCMAATAQMNTSDTNTGGYAASLMPDYLEEVLATFPTEWQNIIRSIRRLENNKGTWAWASRSLFLHSETEVHGHPVWAYDGYDGSTRPLPLYQFSTRYRIKGLGYGASEKGSRYSWWLASPSSKNTTYFARVTSNGDSNDNGASNSHGVAPGFCV